MNLELIMNDVKLIFGINRNGMFKKLIQEERYCIAIVFSGKKKFFD